MKRPATVAITGAGSGIGRALALAYAAAGARLGLVGRNRERLEAVAAECRRSGAVARALVADVTDRAGIAAALRALDDEAPIDLFVANAGISAATPPGCPIESPEDAAKVVTTNLLGALYSVHPVLAAMRARKRGQIALMGSLSARLPLASSPAYAASKAALESYGAGLRAALRDEGIAVCVISPGFVESPMSRRVMGPRPFLVDDLRAAAIIRRGLAQNRARIAFPAALSWGAALAQALPPSVAALVLRPFAFHVREEG